MIASGPVAGGSSKSLRNSHAREVNSVHSWYLSSKMLRSSELDTLFSMGDACGIRQPHDDLLVIVLTIEEFNIHQC